MSKENEIRTISTLTKCIVKLPGSCGAELATRDQLPLIFKKLVAHLLQLLTMSGGPDQIQVAQNKKS